MTCEKIMDYLRSLQNEKNREGMARYGINASNAFGVSMVALRELAKKTGRNHSLALELWETGIHEARILAALVADAKQVTEEQMEEWVKDIDSRDVCDQVCSNLWDRTPFVFTKANQWSRSEHEFTKRAAFVLMAASAVHNKKAGDKFFSDFLKIIIRESTDDRNFVRKAVNWSLRQIGKHNRTLHSLAVKCALELSNSSSKSARWIGKDALRELQNPKIINRLPA